MIKLDFVRYFKTCFISSERQIDGNVWLLQAEDSRVVSDRWSMLLDNISVIIAQHSDSSCLHVTAVAELLISTLVDYPSQLDK